MPHTLSSQVATTCALQTPPAAAALEQSLSQGQTGKKWLVPSRERVKKKVDAKRGQKVGSPSASVSWA